MNSDLPEKIVCVEDRHNSPYPINLLQITSLPTIR